MQVYDSFQPSGSGYGASGYGGAYSSPNITSNTSNSGLPPLQQQHRQHQSAGHIDDRDLHPTQPSGAYDGDDFSLTESDSENDDKQWWRNPMMWLCAVIVLVGLVSFFVAVKFQSLGSQPPVAVVVHPNCNRHVNELLQRRQGALVEQNKQMQEVPGTLQGLGMPAQKWEEAVQSTTAVVSHLRPKLKSAKDTAEKANNQILKWSPVPGGSTTSYMGTMAKVVTALEDLEIDFKGWCETQHATFNAAKKPLEDNVRLAAAGNIVNMGVENTILQRIMKTGLEGLRNMKTKIAGLPPDLNETPTVVLKMGVETCEKRGPNKGWETGFTEQVATAQDLKGRGSLLVDSVSNDYIKMKDVTDNLDMGNSIEDVVQFQTQVVPQLNQLLNLLDNHCENVGTV